MIDLDLLRSGYDDSEFPFRAKSVNAFRLVRTLPSNIGPTVAPVPPFPSNDITAATHYNSNFAHDYVWRVDYDRERCCKLSLASLSLSC
jgi:hypothetical protein